MNGSRVTVRLRRAIAPSVAAAVAFCSAAAHGAEQRKTISREDPAFDVANSRLAVGGDGRVLLASARYVLALDRDGTGRLGGETAYAVRMAAANAAGVIATANAHFEHSVLFWSSRFAPLGAASDFLDRDDVGWYAPSDVEQGPSGDFYALDPNRARVVRLTGEGHVVAVFPLEGIGEDMARTAPQLRVWEPGRRFYVLAGRGTLHVLDFEGRPIASALTGVRPEVDGWGGGFDVTADGRVVVLERDADVVTVLDGAGRPAGRVRLDTRGHAGPVSDLRVFGDDVVVKRRDPHELFEVYDRATGALRRVVPADIEEFALEAPTGPWAAGARVSISLRRVSGRYPAPAAWRAWLRPVGAERWVELPIEAGQIYVPADAAGFYQLRAAPSADGSASEYAFERVVEIRRPATRGVIAIATEHNRLYFGRGERIPFEVAATVVDPMVLPDHVRIQLVQDAREIAATDLPFTPRAPSAGVVAATLTRALMPGRYELTAEAPGFSVIRQPLEIGPGLETKSPFQIVAYGDYGPEAPRADAFSTPEIVAAHVARAAALGVNLFAERFGLDDSYAETLHLDPFGAPRPADGSLAALKTLVDGPVRQNLAAYGAAGIEQQGILLAMDANLPCGTGIDRRSPAQLAEVIRAVTTAFGPFPAFRGWSWAANWWPAKTGADAATPAERPAYEAALARARATGAWDPILDAVAERTFALPVDAERAFDRVLQRVAPGKSSAMTGPYRAVGVSPPIAFGAAGEVDLQYQAEQIQPPEVTPHDVDFYKRPGKRAWGHPELWNEDGTGGMVFPTLLEMLMRGADGIGWSGAPPWFGPVPSDPRSAAPGEVSVVRALADLSRDYGPWLTTLQSADPVAIVVSSRMMAIDTWGKLGGEYFGRLYEAYGACLYAHRPAAFVFSEDATPERLRTYRAILVVGQRVAIEPRLATAIAGARAAGVRVYTDGTSRPDVGPFHPLGIAFDRVERDPSAWQDDAAYARIPGYLVEHAAALDRLWGADVAPVAELQEPQVLLSERTSGDGRFVWAVDDVMPGLDPGLAWRTGLLISTRMPVVTPMHLAARGAAVYDAFANRLEADPSAIPVDLRGVPARLFAVLPRPIGGLRIMATPVAVAGQAVRWSLAVQDDHGAPIRANLPVVVTLSAADGRAVRREARATSADGPLSERWVAPLGLPPGDLTLSAQELIGGKSAAVTIHVEAPRAEATFDGPGDPPPPDPTATVQAAGGSSSRERVEAPAAERFGAHLKDIAVSSSGDLAILNAMDWATNVYGVDLATGQVRWRRRVGNHFAYDPESLPNGFAVQSFDRTTAEGYHLTLFDVEGRAQRRFALYGLPARATHWAFASQLADRIDAFATSPAGDWIASAGNLGLVVWTPDGRRLWGLDGWKTSRRQLALLAPDRETLVALEGPEVTAYDARSGRRRWRLPLANGGHALGGAAAGGILAVRADMDGGRVFLIRDGRVVATIPSAADDVALAPAGSLVALTTGNELKVFDGHGALAWTMRGDDTLRRPRVRDDGERLVVGSELGTVYVLDATGRRLWTHGAGALAVGAWLPGGDLLTATWMGRVERRDAQFAARWTTRISPEDAPDEGDVRATLARPDPTPTVRVESWGNAATPAAGRAPFAGAPPGPNLLASSRAILNAVVDGRRAGWQHPVEALTDGKADPPDSPWLGWTTVATLDSGWSGRLGLEVDAFRTQLRVRGVTFEEDPRHPESWLRDMRLQYWDAARESWQNGPYLLSNAATHTHWFERPLESTRFRFVSTGPGSWPSGNVRLGEIVFHGDDLGTSHPDVLARRPVAVLFDERASDITPMHCAGASAQFPEGDAYAGRLYFALSGAGACGPDYEPPFGHALRNWNFTIAEHPQPGQYRWLQFAWKALSSTTTGMSLLLGRAWPGGGYAFTAGAYAWREGVLATKAAGAPSREWTEVVVDLWEMYHDAPVDIQSIGFAAAGGPAAFDRVVLGRSREDLARANARP